MIDFAVNFAELFKESAPWLVLGLLVAGVMKWLVPIEILQNHMGKRDLWTIIKAAFIGAPLPLCSCGVIPAAIGLRRSGACKPATSSFLVATPETGVDSISVSYALLGPFFAVIRPVSAILSAIYVGLLTLFLTDKEHEVQQNVSEEAGRSCCTRDKQREKLPEDKTEVVKANDEQKSSCCTENNNEKIIKSHSKIREFVDKLLKLLQFSFGKLLEDITKWLLLGLLLAAVIKTWVPTDFLTQWGSGALAMIVMALIGIPMYICATASTPVAAGFLAAGISPGAVLVFMLAGPATNLSTMGMIRQEMGNRTLLAYLIGIFSGSITLGVLTNFLVETYQFEIYQVATQQHHMSETPIYLACSVLLAVLMIRNFFNGLISLRQSKQ